MRGGASSPFGPRSVRRGRASPASCLPSLVVAGCGGALRIAGCRLVHRPAGGAESASSLPSFVHVAIDSRVLLFALAVCAASGLAFRLAPPSPGARRRSSRHAGWGAGRPRRVSVPAAAAGHRADCGGVDAGRRRQVDAAHARTSAGIRSRVRPRRSGGGGGSFASECPRRCRRAAHARAAAGDHRARAEVSRASSAALTWDLPLNATWLQTRVRLVDREADL